MSAARLALPLRIAIAAGLTPIVDKFITKPFILKETPFPVLFPKTPKTDTALPIATVSEIKSKTVVMKTPVPIKNNSNNPRSWIVRKFKEIRNRGGSKVESNQ